MRRRTYQRGYECDSTTIDPITGNRIGGYTHDDQYFKPENERGKIHAKRDNHAISKPEREHSETSLEGWTIRQILDNFSLRVERNNMDPHNRANRLGGIRALETFVQQEHSDFDLKKITLGDLRKVNEGLARLFALLGAVLDKEI